MSGQDDFETLKSIAEECRNWGKWGPDDQLGTLNYITPEKIVQATQLVRHGRVFSLAVPFEANGIQGSSKNRRFDPMRFMLRSGRDTVVEAVMGAPKGFGGADDVIMMPSHAATHWDALAHVFWDGKMWNGYDATLVGTQGAAKNGIESFRDRIITRGVLLDIPRLAGVDWLEMGYAITVEDLEAAIEAEGVVVGTGDILLVRTGKIAYCRSKGSWADYASGAAPGLSIRTLTWLKGHEVAGVASDTYGVEVRPHEIKGMPAPWHRVAIPNMGLLMGEIFDLEALAADCAADRVYEFLLIAPPLPLVGGVGSPVNPMAIK